MRDTWVYELDVREEEKTMSNRSLLQIPDGVQCFYGKAAHLRRAIEQELAEVFAGWSYEEILLPLFDYDDVFERGGGPAKTDRIYRFVGRDGEVMALRPDFTALVAKVAASRMQARELPIRLFYSGEVLRYQPPQAGRQEDLFQIGLEHIGDGLESDVEILLVALEALARLGLTDALLTIGHAGFILGILESESLAGERLPAVLEAMRFRDREGLRSIFGGDPPSVLMEAMQLFGDAEVLERAQKVAREPRSRMALERLRSLAAVLKGIGLDKQVQFDLSEVLGFDYYTGMIFEIHMPGAGIALGGGGRYDSLMGRFGAHRPAVGFSMSLDRLAHVLSSTEAKWMERQSPTTVEKADDLTKMMSEAIELRRRGRRVRVG
jgi:ATP phosphoribosyltransferase regulatory subunit